MRPTRHLRVPEEKLARAGALGAVLAAVPGGLVGLSVAGAAAGAALAGGSVLVAALVLATTPLYRLASDASIIAAHMAALGLRLLLGVAIFAALAQLTAVPLDSLAAGVGVGLVASIIAEMVAASRDPRFFWLVTPTTTSASLSHSGTERQRA